MVVGIVRRWSPRSWNGLKCRWRNCIRFSCRNNSSLRLNSLGPLCLWQCFLFGHCGVISKNAFQCCQICNFLILFENCIFSRYEIWFLLFCEYDEDALTGKFSLERVGALDKAIKDTSDDTFDDTIWQDTRYNLIHRNRRQWHEMSDSVSRASATTPEVWSQKAKSNCYSVHCLPFSLLWQVYPNQIIIVILPSRILGVRVFINKEVRLFPNIDPAGRYLL